MIAVVQRVDSASVTVGDELVGQVAHGLCVLLGIHVDDQAEHATRMAAKLARLRIFRDSDDLMNLDVCQVDGSILLVSQFTLLADTSSGNRPSFTRAAKTDQARTLYESVARHLQEDHGIPVQTGRFGAMMQVNLVNDGPVTVILEQHD
ncbi:MAG: D-tyrosyl-tRNA(Tyr) deacylase [Phycisphaerae bacterium]|nr:D-tyrosyl-tRNA(Tyr) deacylase [Phycisphaerae bacterium]